MNLNSKTLVALGAGIISLSAVVTTVGNYLVFRGEFERKYELLQMQITEDLIENLDDAICQGRHSGNSSEYQVCMKTFKRLQTIRKRKGYSNR